MKSVCRTLESEKKNFSKKKRVVVTGETIKSKYVNNTKKNGLVNSVPSDQLNLNIYYAITELVDAWKIFSLIVLTMLNKDRTERFERRDVCETSQHRSDS